MCGRYSLALPPSRLGDRIYDNYGLSVDEYFNTDDVRTTHNVAPTYNEPVIRMMKPSVSKAGTNQEHKVEKRPQAGADEIPVEDSQEQHHHDKLNKSEQAKEDQEEPNQTRTVIQGMRWGFIPTWEKTWPSMQDTMRRINTRDDGLLSASSKGIWTPSKNRRRCAILAEGYYEWAPPASAPAPAVPPAERKDKPGRLKQPYYIKRKNGKLLFLAGLYDRCDLRDEPDKGPIYSYTIITTDATPDMKFIHDRMPVVLFPDKDIDGFKQWLDPNVTWTDKLSDYLRRNANYEKEGNMEFYPVDRRVGKVGTDSKTYVIPFDSKENKSNIANYFEKKPSHKESEQPSHKKESSSESKSKAKHEPSHGIKKESSSTKAKHEPAHEDDTEYSISQEVKREHQNDDRKSSRLAYEDDQFEDEPDVKNETNGHGDSIYAEDEGDEFEDASDDEFHSPQSDMPAEEVDYSPDESEVEAEYEDAKEPGEPEPTDEATVDVGEDVQEQVQPSGKRSKQGGNGDIKRRRSPRNSGSAESKPATTAAKSNSRGGTKKEKKIQEPESKSTTKKSSPKQSPKKDQKLTTHEKRVEAGRKGAKARLEHRAEEAKLKREEIGEETHKKLSAAGKKGGHLGGLARAGKIPQEEYGDEEDEDQSQEKNQESTTSHQDTSESRPGGHKARKASMDIDFYEEELGEEESPEEPLVYENTTTAGNKRAESRKQHYSEEAKRKQGENSVDNRQEQHSEASNKTDSKKRHKLTAPFKQEVERKHVNPSKDSRLVTTEQYNEPARNEHVDHHFIEELQKPFELTSHKRHRPSTLLEYTEPIDNSNVSFLGESLTEPQLLQLSTPERYVDAGEKETQVRESRHEEHMDSTSVFSISRTLVEPHHSSTHEKHVIEKPQEDLNEHGKRIKVHNEIQREPTHKSQHKQHIVEAGRKEDQPRLEELFNDELLEKQPTPHEKRDEANRNGIQIVLEQPSNYESTAVPTARKSQQEPHEQSFHEKHVKEATHKRVDPNKDIKVIEKHVGEKPEMPHELSSHEKHVEAGKKGAQVQHERPMEQAKHRRVEPIKDTNVIEKHVGEKPEMPHELTSHEKHVEAGKKGAAQVRHGRSMEQAKHESIEPKKLTTTVITEESQEKPHELTSHEKHMEAGKKGAQARIEHHQPSLHEKHVEAGKKGAQVRLEHVAKEAKHNNVEPTKDTNVIEKHVEMPHELTSHEKHVEAGKKGAQVRLEHLAKEAKHRTVEPNKDTNIIEKHVRKTPEMPHELTSHEKHVEAGKKGAQVRLEHVAKEAKHNNVEPTKDTNIIEKHVEMPHGLTSHEKHVEAGKKGAQVRLEHHQPSSHEKHVEAGKKGAQVRHEHLMKQAKQESTEPKTLTTVITTESQEQPQELSSHEKHVKAGRKGAQVRIEHLEKQADVNNISSSQQPQTKKHELTSHEKHVEAGKKGAQVRHEHLMEQAKHESAEPETLTTVITEESQEKPHDLTSHEKHVEAGKKGAQVRLEHLAKEAKHNNVEPTKDTIIEKHVSKTPEMPHELTSHEKHVEAGKKGAQVRLEHLAKGAKHNNVEPTKDTNIIEKHVSKTPEMPHELTSHEKHVEAGKKGAQVRLEHLAKEAKHRTVEPSKDTNIIEKHVSKTPEMPHELTSHEKHVEAGRKGAQVRIEHLAEEMKRKHEDTNKETSPYDGEEEAEPELSVHRASDKSSETHSGLDKKTESKAKVTKAQEDQGQEELSIRLTLSATGPKGAITRNGDGLIQISEDSGLDRHEISTHNEEADTHHRDGSHARLEYVIDDVKSDEANTGERAQSRERNQPQGVTLHDKHVGAGRKDAQVRQEQTTHRSAEPKKVNTGTTTTTEESEEKPQELSSHEKHVRAGRKGAQVRIEHLREQADVGSISSSQQPQRKTHELTSHEKHVEAGRKGAQVRQEHLMEQAKHESTEPEKLTSEEFQEKPHELTSHEKHVKAGKKGAQVRIEHLRGQEDGKHSDSSSDTTVEETDAVARGLTAHEKHVLAGRKGAQVRLEHLRQKEGHMYGDSNEGMEVQEQEATNHGEQVPADDKGEQVVEEESTEKRSANELSTHEKHVLAGRKGAQARIEHLMQQGKDNDTIEESQIPRELTSHEKHVLAGRKGAKVRLEHLRAKSKNNNNNEENTSQSMDETASHGSNHISSAEHDAYSEIGKMGAAARWHKHTDEGKISQEIHEKLSQGGRRGGLARRQPK